MSAAKRRSRSRSQPDAGKDKPSTKDAHEIVYFKRHAGDDQTERSPGRDALNSWPEGVRAKVRAVVVAVAAAPPSRFSGGGYWEAMHNDMAGWFEIRVDGPKREHFRLFCLLDYDAVNDPITKAPVDTPYLVIVDGRRKGFRTTLPESEYAKIRALGAEYRRRNPRSIE